MVCGPVLGSFICYVPFPAPQARMFLLHTSLTNLLHNGFLPKVLMLIFLSFFPSQVHLPNNNASAPPSFGFFISELFFHRLSYPPRTGQPLYSAFSLSSFAQQIVLFLTSSEVVEFLFFGTSDFPLGVCIILEIPPD